ncbi:MAG: hypothetical protein ACLQBJ_08090 [Bryobacteraceae bacterium]
MHLLSTQFAFVALSIVVSVSTRVKAQDAAALEEQYTACEKHHIPADKCTPDIYAQLKAKDSAPLSPEVALGLAVAKTVQAQLLNPASFQVRRISVLPSRLAKDGGAYICVVYGAQAVAGGMVVDSKTFHDKPNKKHPDQLPKLGEMLLNLCEVTDSKWMDLTNEVRLVLSRQ